MKLTFFKKRAHTHTHTHTEIHIVDHEWTHNSPYIMYLNELVLVYFFVFSLWLYSQKITCMPCNTLIPPTHKYTCECICDKARITNLQTIVNNMLRWGTIPKCADILLHFKHGSSMIYRRQRDYYHPHMRIGNNFSRVCLSLFMI